MEEGRNLVDDTYSVGCVLDGGRRLLVLLGAEDLLHVAGGRACLACCILDLDGMRSPIQLTDSNTANKEVGIDRIREGRRGTRKKREEKKGAGERKFPCS